ncbi:hypothetical protein NEFER03_2174 [Nematocida sp. LUAm3]|nr:hypothetical protein NEFER03_2174 [Nematocida sp. LUAm3]KAI5176282.1 hypothetical protein NEFER02_2074 [Nematocida sp. LUAm2]KAI5179246.1 hypothetical protein NEFER01_2100 [Nematocida sp. LUAm1]
MNTRDVQKKHAPSQKRSEKFYELFKSLPKNDPLEYSSTCLLHESFKYYQGRIYISGEHICFYAKGFFGSTSVIIEIKNIISVELSTKMLLQQCLNVVTYEKTYSFRAVSFKEDAYPIALFLWQKIMKVPSRVTSIFQVDLPRPSKIEKEKNMIEKEQVYDISIQKILREITDNTKAREFYSSLTNGEIKINSYINRRTIQFDNEFIDEIYKIDNNSIFIAYHSKGTLCRIYITPVTRNSVKVRAIEKYNYTTQHYFMYIQSILTVCSSSSSRISQIFHLFLLLLFLHRVFSYLFFIF